MSLEPQNSGSEQGLEPIKKKRTPKRLPVFVSEDDLLAILKVSKHKHHKFDFKTIIETIIERDKKEKRNSKVVKDKQNEGGNL